MDTKEKILNTAKNLFLEKGYIKTTVREIALKAGINLALLNYHFKSKDSLFSITIERILTSLTPPLHKILNSDLPVDKKIEKYIGIYIDLLIENPYLVMFILNILTQHPEKLVHIKAIDNLYTTEVFNSQLLEEAVKGNIEKVDPKHLFINILSMISFPFAIKPYITYKENLSDKEFDNFLLERKIIIFETVINTLKLKEKS